MIKGGLEVLGRLGYYEFVFLGMVIFYREKG